MISGQPPSPGPIRSEFAADPEVADLVRAFVGEMPEKIERLKQTWQGQQIEEVRRLVHQLKGASAGYGFPQIGKAAADLERTIEALASGVATATTQQLRGQFESLVSLCGRVRE